MQELLKTFCMALAWRAASDRRAAPVNLIQNLLVTYCDGEACELSRDLADQLKAHGLKDVLVLKNGWTLWP